MNVLLDHLYVVSYQGYRESFLKAYLDRGTLRQHECDLALPRLSTVVRPLQVVEAMTRLVRCGKDSAFVRQQSIQLCFQVFEDDC